MDKIDEELKKGSTVLTWKSHGINEFIVQTMALVKDASDILIKINANVDEMEVLLQQEHRALRQELSDVVVCPACAASGDARRQAGNGMLDN